MPLNGCQQGTPGHAGYDMSPHRRGPGGRQNAALRLSPAGDCITIIFRPWSEYERT
jgi:hypothetical protein